MLVSFLSVCFVIKRYIEQQKIIMSEEVNRKCHPKNAVVRLSTPALTLSATCTASQTDRQTDESMTPIADHTVQQCDRLKTSNRDEK